ncbi:unnamed protein product [Diabrotica balteata]|uniref:ANK_REP_REGION domain-containing protein n=1 Tax=Diabrotica balteata TaxID=107213 RepID=A0A9N9SQH6_DIABA|nr:unnamed protein product [Diabrotica balteata]
MGNTESNVTSGVKKQAGAALQPIYKLCDLKGGGLLVELMKRATQNKQYAEIDHAIKTKVEHFLYNKGAGRYIPISQLVLLRNKERARHKLLPQLRTMENPEDFEVNDEGPEVSEEEYQKNANVNIHERCFGNFMCPEDQKFSRSDSLDHEWVNVCQETNYEGYVYWGEYPLTFAACLGQEESFRLILARGADPDAQDSNGNTVLHLLVIKEKSEHFDMAYEVGSSLSIRNNQNLTPLTLAAKLARTEMFFHILNLEREIYWQIGSITCAAYPLSQIDTIDMETGHICKISALNLVVFGDKDEHLELLDGLLIDLLNAKWNTFVKFKFYRQFFTFAFYFIISLFAFTLRPGPPEASKAAKNSTNATIHSQPNSTVNTSLNVILHINETLKKIKSKGGNGNDDDYDVEEWWENLREECRLMQLDSLEAKIRIGAEVAITIGSFLYLVAAFREAGFLGLRMFFENLVC